MHRRRSRRPPADTLCILPEISPDRRAIAWACSRTRSPDDEHLRHTARSARSWQREVCGPAPSRWYRRCRSPWSSTAPSSSTGTKDRAVPRTAPSSRPWFCARCRCHAARTSSPAGAAVGGRPISPRSLAPISSLPPCSSRSVAAAWWRSSPCSRRRTSGKRPESPSSRRECIRSVRWSLPRSAAGPCRSQRSASPPRPGRERFVPASDAAPEVAARRVSGFGVSFGFGPAPASPSRSSSSSPAADSSSALRAFQAASNNASCSFDNCSLLRLRCASSSSRSRL